ncbi:glycosyltransferase family 2 protein [Providencia stuartii]|uniref:glycosyltransferase family 2 protein n=1 Tax=Providencia TaxID=586 RepID=UPI000D96783E|nr:MULTISPECIES: glycosyltransferase family 2 protein [Providencia]EMD1718127.1 glycosyltransferase [Providencia stuartii]MBG5908325.1 glycosyltransferase [Providencia stuartii]MTC67364.1 glycosyltransferase [Providencia stuartii]WAZ74717.1 glycosyltransferase [Providencia stuartii]SPY61743.1 Hyaluronan synthase [Providencia stuartii]
MTIHSKPFFSIIIPVYNSENYIRDCLLSVKNQSYENFEAIIVDDGSTDNSLDVIRLITSNDSRFTIITRANGGVSMARNTGLTEATGDWVVFIDSDDYIDASFLEVFHERILNNKDVDLIIQKLPVVMDSPCGLFSLEQLFIKTDIFTNSYVGGKAFKRKIICENSIKFDEETNLIEDMIFFIEFSIQSNMFLIINECYYNYRCNISSLTHVHREFNIWLYNSKKIYQLIDMFSKKIKFDINQSHYFKSFFSIQLNRAILSIYQSKANLTLNEIKQMYECFDEAEWRMFRSNIFKQHWKHKISSIITFRKSYFLVYAFNKVKQIFK